MTDERSKGVLDRRALLHAAVAVFGALLSLRPARAQGFDPLSLWRQLRDRKIATKNSSKVVRLVDENGGRSGVLRLVTGGGPEVVLTVRLGSGPKFHAHTVTVTNDTGGSFALEPLPPSQTETSGGEWVVALLEPRHLDVICATDAAVVTVRGWDEQIRSTLGPKEIKRLRDFRSRLQTSP